MEAAKQAIKKVTGRTGHTTDVDEVVNPAVTRETVKPHRHEELTEAVDREVHQDHHHTTVQPISHSETLPEKHSHNILPVKEKEYVHGNQDAAKSKAAAEIGQFTNSSTTHGTRETSSVAPTVEGEHVHHHVHETVQPVIHKETIQPEVVHTTVPVHAVHHAEAQHHGISALPMKTLDDFKQGGGVLSGNETEAHEKYDGPPRSYNKDFQTTTDKVLGHGPGTTHHGADTTSQHKQGSGAGTTHHGADTTSQHKQGSGAGGILNKLNPKTDADRDGKAGIAD